MFKDKYVSSNSWRCTHKKTLLARILFVDFTEAFDSIPNGKMEQILVAYGLPKKTAAAIMMLYRNTKVKVRSPDGDTDYLDIVAGALQWDTLAPYLFIICLDYVLRTSIDKIKENSSKLTKEKRRRYPAKTITDADYADDIALLQMRPQKPKHCYIVWNKPLQASDSMSTHTRRNICASIKQATSSH